MMMMPTGMQLFPLLTRSLIEYCSAAAEADDDDATRPPPNLGGRRKTQTAIRGANTRQSVNF